MRYTPKRDDIPLLSQWIKKFDKSKLVEFFGRGDEGGGIASNPLVAYAQASRLWLVGWREDVL